MKALLILVTLAIGAFSSSPFSPINADDGKLTIQVDGQTVDIHVVSQNSSQSMISTNGNSVTLNGGGRGYLSNSAAANELEIDPKGFYNMYLLGKTLTYTVDNSSVHCSCNSALYFVSMPGFDQSGQPDPTSAGCIAKKRAG